MRLPARGVSQRPWPLRPVAAAAGVDVPVRVLPWHSMSRKRDSQDRRSARPTPGRVPRWAGYATVALLAALLYLPALRYGFIGYDDTLLIVDNREFLSRLGNAPQAFRQDAFRVPGYESSGAYYRPIVTLSLMLDAQVGGVSPRVYHASNLLAHAVSSCLLLALLTALGFGFLPSFLLALAFAAHPAFVSAVAWVPGRVECLVALFTFLSALGFLQYLRGGGRRRSMLHIAAFALALFTKEVAVFVPVPLAAYLRLAHDRSGGRRPWRPLVLGWAAVLVVWFLLRRAAISSHTLPSELLTNLAGNSVVLIHYLGKALIPVNLSVAPTAGGLALYTGLFALVLLSFFLVRRKEKRGGLVIFGAAWYLAFALPPLLVPRVVGLEQRLYLPMAGLLVLALEAGLGRALSHRRPAIVAAVAVVLLFSGLTLERVRVYRSRQAFWENAVATSPGSSYARASLGAVYMSRDRLDDAREQYVRALELNPVEPKANNNLGVIAGRRGQAREAEEFFRREIAVNPRYADAHFNLAMARFQLGDTAAAAGLWRQTVRLQPAHRHALRLLAEQYERLGRMDLAQEYRARLAAAP